MESPPPTSAIDFVVKLSKYCNLRCSYCYEFDQLDDKRRISLASLRAFFENVVEAALQYGRRRIDFIWHGGEPFLIPLDYYLEIGRLQREVIGDRIEVLNLVQTNLTVLTDKHLEFLQQRRFFSDWIGVSFDVYGDQRVDVQGLLRTETVLENLQRLRDAGIKFGAITVLARNTLPHIAAIYRFYDSLGISFRLLPFYKSAFDTQVQAHALGYAEIVDAFCTVFDAWLASPTATRVHPLADYLTYALAFLGDRPKRFHDPASGETVFLVDTDGETYGVADTYAPGRAYGNVFTQDFGDVLAAPARQQAVADAHERMARHCAGCPYHGHCPGTFAADATAEQRRMLKRDGCPVRAIVTHIVGRIENTDAAQRLRSLPADLEPALIDA
jgi:uncharacterized protein